MSDHFQAAEDRHNAKGDFESLRKAALWDQVVELTKQPHLAKTCLLGDVVARFVKENTS